MFKLFFWQAERGQRTQQMALWALVASTVVILAGLYFLESPDLVALATLGGAPAAAVQAILSGANVAKAKARAPYEGARNGATDEH